jgi:hypothetical protein
LAGRMRQMENSPDTLDARGTAIWPRLALERKKLEHIFLGEERGLFRELVEAKLDHVDRTRFFLFPPFWVKEGGRSIQGDERNTFPPR